MEPLDDRWYLEPPSEPEWCVEHDEPKPCQGCIGDDAEWRADMERETGEKRHY